MAKDVLFEIGLEELPARFIDQAEKQLKINTEQWLKDLRISYEDLVTFSTPRRLAIQIKKIAENQTTIEKEVRGPSLKIAKDANGNWTKAAHGFTKSQGKTVNDIFTKEVKGTSYIFIKKRINGKPTSQLLPEFKQIITSINFKQTMRWSKYRIRYARPIRWIVALYENQTIPIEIAGVYSSNKTYGHRFLGKEVTIKHPLDYEKILLDNYVIANPKRREEVIVNGIRRLEDKENFKIELDKELLTEVRNLVELPSFFYGLFDPDYLQLPSEVLSTSMKEHQRYFPVLDRDGNLLPHFVSVRNGDEYEIKNVIKGNEKVLKARLHDAKFFYEEDKKESIEFYTNKLKRVVFQEELGTISDKTKRIIQLTNDIQNHLPFDSIIKKRAIRAAEICKFDLVTNMVDEFTELQGIIGEIYALHFGEQKEIAQAIREHYLPVTVDDDLPETAEGAIVSIADKIDTIVGIIAVGLKPTSSHDPYALRRQGSAILKILQNKKWSITIETLIQLSVAIYDQSSVELKVKETLVNDLISFFKQRTNYLFKEQDIEPDVVQSVLHKQIGYVSYTLEKAKLLSSLRNKETFKSTQEALVRVINLAKKNMKDSPVNPQLLNTQSEKILFEKYNEIKQTFQQANNEQDAKKALDSLVKLTDPIHTFFDHTMVMAEEEAIRLNRLSLISEIAKLTLHFADLSLIEWKQHF